MQKPEQSSIVAHTLSLKDRTELFITGILEVISATESLVNLKSSHGPITITGSKLKIKNLNAGSKELSIEGEVSEIKYNNGKKRFLEKCFK